jgi:hypothetical protein
MVYLLTAVLVAGALLLTWRQKRPPLEAAS